MFFQNVGSYKNHVATHPRRHSSNYILAISICFQYKLHKNDYYFQKLCIWTDGLHMTPLNQVFPMGKENILYITFHVIYYSYFPFHSYASTNGLRSIITGIASRMTTRDQQQLVKTWIWLLFHA
jgi:hypothetical protein